MAGAPMPIGIEGLNATPFMDFRGGRVTMDNLSEMRKEELLLANNIVILNDRMPALRPGYTLVRATTPDVAGKTGGSGLALYDFQRSIDRAQFILLQNDAAGGGLFYLDPTMAYAAKLPTPFQGASLTLGKDAASFLDVNSFELFAFSEDAALVLFDSGDGKLSTAPCGLPAPNITLACTPVSGALTTAYDYTYMACFVRKWTDAGGYSYYHVGPPSAGSNVGGPLTAEDVQVVSSAFVDQGTGPTHVWLFRTNDLPSGTTSALFFVAEIALAYPYAGTTFTYVDSTPDDSLDLTRPVPYDNYPPPPGNILVGFNNNAVLAGIAGSPDLVQMSGGDAILLGIPEEAFPPDLFFDIPAGRRGVTAGAVFSERCFLSSLDFWWTLSGYDVSTYQLRDKACEPGAVGRRAVTTTRTHLVWLAEDRNLYAWDGVSTRPENFSKALSKRLAGALSMEDIDAGTLASAELRWYHAGRYSLIMLMVNTGSVAIGQFDWIQMWDASFLGELFDDDVTPVGLVETDFFPSDAFTTTALVKEGFDTYLFAADDAGNVYRWPDSQQDNGKNFGGALCSVWTPLNVFIGPMFHPIPQGEVVKRLFWADVHTTRQDAISSFQLAAVVADSPDMTIPAVHLPVGPLLASSGYRGAAPTALRGRFYEDPRTTMGRWVRLYVIFPDDGGGGQLIRFAITAKPQFGIAP